MFPASVQLSCASHMLEYICRSVSGRVHAQQIHLDRTQSNYYDHIEEYFLFRL